MQFYANSNRLSLKTILFFTAIVVIAFLPVSSFLFFLKNDAFVGYFPPKFFMSESLHAGHLPLWNPYINFGFPQYGDMSGGYWSPITWLIASTVGYNAYTLTNELLLYILIGGMGMYKLANYFQLNKQVGWIAAVAFMCCGYNVGHLQHFNWLSGAAFLPWCCWAYLGLISNFSVKKILITTLLFYFFISSAHPGITISAVYFFVAFAVYAFFKNDNKFPLKERLIKFSTSHLLLLLLLLLLSAGLIAGYLDIIPYFLRGEKVSLPDSLLHPTNAQSWLSVLFPFATVKNDAFYHTDPSMRNCYFGLNLFLFFLLACFSKKNSWQIFLLVTGLLFALLSTGGIFKIFAYKFIPFIGFVRLNGEFRIFALLCFILIAAIELAKFIDQQKTFSGTIKWIYYFVEILVLSALIFGLYKAISTGESIVHKGTFILAQNGFAAKLKALIDAISFYDTFWIQGIIQLLLLWSIKWCLKNQQWNLLRKIAVADMVFACLINIPFTGVGKASVAQIQTILNHSPKGIPAPALQPIMLNDSSSLEQKFMIGDWSMYNKQIGTKLEVTYPIILKNSRAYFDKDAITGKENHLDKPFIFGADSNIFSINLSAFSPQGIEVNVNSNAASQLIIQQNYYPHWYYVNDKERKAMNAYETSFMSAPVSKGNNHIRIEFEPTIVKVTMLISAIVFCMYCLLLLYYFKRSAKTKKVHF
jgi:hypothetical protein